MPNISIEDFLKLDLRVGKIVDAQEVEGSEKLIRMEVDFGEGGSRIIFAGVRKWYNAEDLKGRLGIFADNLEPKKMMGEESCGMLLAAEDEESENCVILVPDKDIPPGTKVC